MSKQKKILKQDNHEKLTSHDNAIDDFWDSSFDEVVDSKADELVNNLAKTISLEKYLKLTNNEKINYFIENFKVEVSSYLLKESAEVIKMLEDWVIDIKVIQLLSTLTQKWSNHLPSLSKTFIDQIKNLEYETLLWLDSITNWNDSLIYFSSVLDNLLEFKLNWTKWITDIILWYIHQWKFKRIWDVSAILSLINKESLNESDLKNKYLVELLDDKYYDIWNIKHLMSNDSMTFNNALHHLMAKRNWETRRNI